MQKKLTKKRLTLQRETLQQMDDKTLNSVAGGCNTSNTCFTMCWCICPVTRAAEQQA